MPDLTKDIKEDQRSRLIRWCEQLLQKKHTVKISYAWGETYIIDRYGSMAATKTLEAGLRMKEALEDDWPNSFEVIGSPADQQSPGCASTTEAQPEAAAELLTTDEVLERWPALTEYYANAKQTLGSYASKGRLNAQRGGPGKTNRYRIDGTFLEWIDSLNLPEAAGQAEEKEADSPGETAAPPVAEPEESAQEEDPEEEGFTLSSTTMEDLLVDMLDAHMDYVEALHEGRDLEEPQAAVDDITSRVRDQVRLIMSRVILTERVLEDRGGRVAAISPRVNGALTRITESESVQELYHAGEA